MANKTQKEYSRYIYQITKSATLIATFCMRQDAEEMAAKVGGKVCVIGAY